MKYPEGNCKHIVSMHTCAYEVPKDEHRPPEKKDRYEHPPVVWVVNDNDSYYGECFTSRKQINGLITRLKNARDTAWPIS